MPNCGDSISDQGTRFDSILSTIVDPDGKSGKVRPCVIAQEATFESDNEVYLMGTFGGKKHASLAPELARFAALLYTGEDHHTGENSFEHVHTSPQWQKSPSWIVTIPLKRQHRRKRWASGKAPVAGPYISDVELRRLQLIHMEQLERFEEEQEDDPTFLARYTGDLVVNYEVRHFAVTVVDHLLKNIYYYLDSWGV